MITRLFVAALLASSAWPATIHYDFPGGSLERVEAVAANHFRLYVDGQTDQDHRNRQASWYSFRVDGAAREAELTLDIVGLPGEYNYQPNRGAISGDTPPVISYDGKRWEHVTGYEYDAAEPRLRLHVRPRRSRFWIAHTPPYTEVELKLLRGAVVRNRAAREESIGGSVEGRALLLWTIGSENAPRTVWLMFRQHAWESGSSWVGDSAVRALLADAALRDGVCWKILPMADPDGVAHGGVRFNRHGYDLNRNWDVDRPEQMPEITAQRAAIRGWLRAGHRIDLFYTLHNTETAEYLEGPVGALAEALFARLRNTLFDPSRPFVAVAPNRDAGRANVIQQLNAEGVPAFLMEQRIARGEKLGRLPEVGDRAKFGRELVAAIHEVVSRSR